MTQNTEAKLRVEAFVQYCLDQGFVITVFYEFDDEPALDKSNALDAIMEEAFACDAATMQVWDWPNSLGIFQFIHTNGEDVLHDCTDNEFTKAISARFFS